MIKLGNPFAFKFYCSNCDKQTSQLIITDKNDYIKTILIPDKCKNCKKNNTYYKYCKECLSNIENINIWEE